jgi:protein-arginine kinase activator protein McsA
LLSNPDKFIKQKEKEMEESVKMLDFETAAIIRDEIKELIERNGIKLKKNESRRKKF